MLQQIKLAIEKQRDASAQSATFNKFWLINALTTFLFGYKFLPPLFSPLLQIIPLSDAANGIISAVLGGFAAVAVLDSAYTEWERIKLHNSETEEQYRAAQSAESMAFGFSLAYTVISLASFVFGFLMDEAMLRTIEVFGAGSFILVCVLHLYFWREHAGNSIETRRRKADAISNGKHHSEQLQFQSLVYDDALRAASQAAEQQRKPIVDALTDQWSRQLLLLPVGTNIPQLTASNANQTNVDSGENHQVLFPDAGQGVGFASPQPAAADARFQQAAAAPVPNQRAINVFPDIEN